MKPVPSRKELHAQLVEFEAAIRRTAGMELLVGEAGEVYERMSSVIEAATPLRESVRALLGADYIEDVKRERDLLQAERIEFDMRIAIVSDKLAAALEALGHARKIDPLASDQRRLDEIARQNLRSEPVKRK